MSSDAKNRTAGRVIEDPFDGSHRYQIIYCDPPWQYRDTARAGERGAGFKYPLMSNQQIAELPVANLAADDCALFMWATWPKLPEVMPIFDAWGFKYRTLAFVWVKRSSPEKLHWGMGNWTRANTEPVLFGTRGRPIRQSASVHQVVEAPLGRHSQKPAMVRDRIITLMGDISRIELFARDVAPGWDVWGNEVGGDNSPMQVLLDVDPGTPQGREDAVMAIARRQGRVTRGDVMEQCKMSPTVTSAALGALVKKGALAPHGEGRGRWYKPV